MSRPASRSGTEGYRVLSDEPQVTAASGIVIVTLAGELDVRAVGQLELRLAAALTGSPEQVIIDLRQVSYLDCPAAQAIVAASQLPSGRLPVLRGASPLVLRVLETSDLDGHCEIRP